MTVYTITLPTMYVDIRHSIGFYKFVLVEQGHAAYPSSHLEDANKLTADAIVELFQIILNDGVTKIFQKQDNTVTWQGDEYEGTSIKISGVGQYSDDQTSRPTIMLYNPQGVFNSLVDQGYLDGAKVIRYRILKQHLADDLPIYRRQMWRISRVASLKTVANSIACEMRDMLDGQNFTTPARMYIPPEFPAVSIA